MFKRLIHHRSGSKTARPDGGNPIGGGLEPLESRLCLSTTHHQHHLHHEHVLHVQHLQHVAAVAAATAAASVAPPPNNTLAARVGDAAALAGDVTTLLTESQPAVQTNLPSTIATTTTSATTNAGLFNTGTPLLTTSSLSNGTGLTSSLTGSGTIFSTAPVGGIFAPTSTTPTFSSTGSLMV